ncbi:hypothetical protein AADR41_17275 [Streptomyces sp. CLV115]|uniref:hypothetical protein n=1 Tax=Streptomyces sp. CLV115 TaxID=3138502 RepID=UPI00313CA6EC
MNRSLGEEQLTAHRAVLGKYPGRTMGYKVLRSSLPGNRADTYLWRAAATGAPEGNDPDGALPWRVFLGASDTHPAPVCACVDTMWDGTADGTGAPSYTWRLTLFDWPDVSRSALTWSGIDRALPAEPPAPPDDDAPTEVGVPNTSADELAAVVDDLGFAWASGVAALLLDDRQVAITPGPGRPLPDVTDRVRALDAICSLLPYACRSWLSAATWIGEAQHDLRLFFAPTARAGQCAAVFGGAPPQEPRGSAARGYLKGLRALRAKTDDTRPLVRHLLAATEPATSAPGPGGVLKALREADLLDTVVEEVRSGEGDLTEVARVLDRHPAASLDDRQLTVLTGYLVHGAHGRQARAGALLAEQWSDRLRSLLVGEVLAAGDPARSFERAERYLGLVHNVVELRRPGTFDELFHALVEAQEPTGGWAGSLIYMAEDQWGRSTERADRILFREPAVGKTWLRYLLKNKRRDLKPLERLVRRARTELAADITPGWLRFAAVLLGDPPDGTTATDAADFAEAFEEGWRTTLEIARLRRRPEVLGPMWPRLWRIARNERGLGEAVARLVPVEERARGAVAADADLFCAATRTGTPGMPRLERLADDSELRAYIAALINRLGSDGELRRLAVDALLAGTPGQRGWRVIEQLGIVLPENFLQPVCEVLHRRLTGHGRPLNDLDVPAYLMEQVSQRYDMAWLRPVHEFRRAVNDHASYERLARLLLAAGAPLRLPVQLLDTVAGWTVARGPYGLEQVTRFMDELAADLPGLRLYRALVRDDRYAGLRVLLTEHSRQQRARHDRIVAELGHGPDAPMAAEPAAEGERRGVLGKMGRIVPGKRR